MNSEPRGEREIFQRQTNAGVGQDNKPPRRLTAASVQPVAAETQAVTATIDPVTIIPPADNRQTHHGSETRQLELIAGRVPSPIKSEVDRLAQKMGWTQSRTVRHLVEQALARSIAEQFGVMIRQTIQEVVREEFRIYTNRMGKLTFNAYLAAEQGRLLHIEDMRVNLGPEQIGDLTQIITRSRKQARDNLKFYNYSTEDVEKAATETLPWQ